MKKELGLIDRMVSWCVHKLSGIKLDRTSVHTQQAGAPKPNR